MTLAYVFCGSNIGQRPAYEPVAPVVGEALAQHGRGLIYGGGNVGLMGADADATLACSEEVIGIIPAFLQARKVAHTGFTRLEVVGLSYGRTAHMRDRADAFLALPCDCGTLDEFARR